MWSSDCGTLSPTHHCSYYYLVTAAYPYSEASGLQPLWYAVRDAGPISLLTRLMTILGTYRYDSVSLSSDPSTPSAENKQVLPLSAVSVHPNSCEFCIHANASL